MTQTVSGKGDEETAFAKINLALHVRKRLSDGYHQLETVFAFIDDGDRISVEVAETTSLSISGPFGKGLSQTDNLILDAALLLQNHMDHNQAVNLKLDKRLPVASGIGGGSADAAATLRLLNRFWNAGLSNAQLAELSASLGADIPACVLSKTFRGSGIGQDLSEIESEGLRNLSVLLVNPRRPLPTELIFDNWNGEDGGGLTGTNALEIAKSSRNDLTVAACDFAPEIGDILDAMRKTDAIVTRMSGSGATCFGLFETNAKAVDAKSDFDANMPDAWTMMGKVR